MNAAKRWFTLSLLRGFFLPRSNYEYTHDL